VSEEFRIAQVLRDRAAAHPDQVALVDGDGRRETYGELARAPTAWPGTCSREVRVRGASVTPGYFDNPEETDKALDEEGWLRTGDGGYVDAEGYLFLTDRIKDMIVTGAENVYPAEVEEVLAQHPHVAEVAVFGVPDERWGEVVTAAVVVCGDGEPQIDELVAFARERLADYKLPRAVHHIAEMPKTATGKVSKKDLRARYG
jgi:acyl-CoA synthetase (AMP-forming)/AMP-acid ligase II